VTAAEVAVGKERAAGELPADGGRQAQHPHRAWAQKGGGGEGVGVPQISGSFPIGC